MPLRTYIPKIRRTSKPNNQHNLKGRVFCNQYLRINRESSPPAIPGNHPNKKFTQKWKTEEQFYLDAGAREREAQRVSRDERKKSGRMPALRMLWPPPLRSII